MVATLEVGEGGVLVNGNGPTASQKHSQGYGGGSGYEGTPQHGLSGVILLGCGCS